MTSIYWIEESLNDFHWAAKFSLHNVLRKAVGSSESSSGLTGRMKCSALAELCMSCSEQYNVRIESGTVRNVM